MQTQGKAYIITGPTSGIGRETAFEVAKFGTVVLVGRDRSRLAETQRAIERRGGQAVAVVCDLSDMVSVRRAALEIAGLPLTLAGLVNNAGIMQMRATKSAQGWDMSYATNHLGPFVLTETLLPYLPDGANVVFVASGVEDPERKPAKAAGFRGARYISAEASARGEWEPGGARMAGLDAYATSKQGTLVAAYEFGRENPRLRVNAVEPGFSPATDLGREAPMLMRLVMQRVLPLLAPHIKYWSTPKLAGRVIAKVLRNEEGVSGVYYDDEGHPMQPSAQVRDAQFRARVMAETRALLKGSSETHKSAFSS